MNIEPKASGTRWTRQEEILLLDLHDNHDVTFPVIAEKLSRKPNAVEHRYLKIKENLKIPKGFVWTNALDRQLIDSRQKAMPIRNIAASMDLPLSLVQRRFTYLRNTNKLPHDVVSMYKRTPKIQFSDQEDEIILRLYIAMTDEEEIFRLTQFPGKTLSSIKARRTFHQHGGPKSQGSEMYTKLLAESNRPGRAWTKNDVLERKFEVGAWRNY